MMTLIKQSNNKHECCAYLSWLHLRVEAAAIAGTDASQCIMTSWHIHLLGIESEACS